MKPYGYRIRRMDGDKCVDDRVEYEVMHPDILANLQRVFRVEITELFAMPDDVKEYSQNMSRSILAGMKALQQANARIQELDTELTALKAQQDREVRTTSGRDNY